MIIPPCNLFTKILMAEDKANDIICFHQTKPTRLNVTYTESTEIPYLIRNESVPVTNLSQYGT